MKTKILKFESISQNDELIIINICTNVSIKKAIEAKNILLKSFSIHREKNKGYWSRSRTLDPGGVYITPDALPAPALDKILANYVNVKNKYYNQWQDNFCNN